MRKSFGVAVNQWSLRVEGTYPSPCQIWRQSSPQTKQLKPVYENDKEVGVVEKNHCSKYILVYGPHPLMFTLLGRMLWRMQIFQNQLKLRTQDFPDQSARSKSDGKIEKDYQHLTRGSNLMSSGIIGKQEWREALIAEVEIVQLKESGHDLMIIQWRLTQHSVRNGVNLDQQLAIKWRGTISEGNTRAKAHIDKQVIVKQAWKPGRYFAVQRPGLSNKVMYLLGQMIHAHTSSRQVTLENKAVR